MENDAYKETLKYLYKNRSQKITSGDFDFSYIELGTGSTIVFLHGLVGTKSAWRTCMRGLSNRYNVISLDVPGIHIFKQLPSQRTSFAALSEWLTTFLDHKNIKSAHLIGHSVSAMLCMYVASKHKERIKSLNLVSPPQWYPSSKMMEPTIWHLFEKIQNADHPFEMYLSHLTYRQAGSPKYFRSVQEKAFNFFKPRVISTLEDLNQSSVHIKPRASEIEAPTQLIYGAQDKFISEDLISDLKIILPGLKSAKIDECAHLPHIEQKEQTLSLLKRHVDLHERKLKEAP